MEGARTTSSVLSPIFLPMSLDCQSDVWSPPLDDMPGTTSGIVALFVGVLLCEGLSGLLVLPSPYKMGMVHTL